MFEEDHGSADKGVELENSSRKGLENLGVEFEL
jgi:hypothetical protein